MSVNNREAYELLQVFIRYCQNLHNVIWAKDIPGMHLLRVDYKERDRIIDEFLCGTPLHDINKREAYVAKSTREPLEKRIRELESENAALKKQIELMKCCGNCEHNYSYDPLAKL